MSNLKHLSVQELLDADRSAEKYQAKLRAEISEREREIAGLEMKVRGQEERRRWIRFYLARHRDRLISESQS